MSAAVQPCSDFYVAQVSDLLKARNDGSYGLLDATEQRLARACRAADFSTLAASRLIVLYRGCVFCALRALGVVA